MNELKAMIASQIVAAQIRMGAKHPSPPLIAEAVDTAEAIVAELDKRADEREKLAHLEAEAAAAPTPPSPPAAGSAVAAPPVIVG